MKSYPSIRRINGATSFYAYCGVPRQDGPYTAPDATIRYGSRGDGVRWIQYMLNAAGYDCGKIDGIAGVKTIAAIRAYQQEHGLAVDGLAGKKTVAALAGESIETAPVGHSSEAVFAYYRLPLSTGSTPHFPGSSPMSASINALM